MLTRGDLSALLENSNVQAFLIMIRLGEGTLGWDGYRKMFGGGLFDDLSDHPRKYITKRLGGKKLTSSAAGAYQFLVRTWDGLVKQYGFTDFSPASQDQGAVALIAGRKALQDVLEGRWEAATRKCAKEWASLPWSPYGQPVLSVKRALDAYLAAGGQVAAEAPTDTTTQTSKEGGPVIPFLASIATAALPQLLNAAPDVVKLLADKEKPVSERNTDIALKLIDVAQRATGEQTAQSAVEAIASDPKAAEAFQNTVREEWFSLQEAGGSGIDGARKFAVEYAKSPRNWPLEVVTYMFVTIFGFAALMVMVKAEFSDDQITMMLQAVIGLSLMVGGFWLGSSYTTSRSRGAGAQPSNQAR